MHRRVAVILSIMATPMCITATPQPSRPSRSSRAIPVIPVIPVIPGFSGHLKLYPFTAGVNKRPMTSNAHHRKAVNESFQMVQQ